MPLGRYHSCLSNDCTRDVFRNEINSDSRGDYIGQNNADANCVLSCIKFVYIKGAMHISVETGGGGWGGGGVGGICMGIGNITLKPTHH